MAAVGLQFITVMLVALPSLLSPESRTWLTGWLQFRAAPFGCGPVAIRPKDHGRPCRSFISPHSSVVLYHVGTPYSIWLRHRHTTYEAVNLTATSMWMWMGGSCFYYGRQGSSLSSSDKPGQGSRRRSWRVGLSGGLHIKWGALS
jgi:hypothetical protein